MNKDIIKRVLNEADEIIKSNDTVRNLAVKFRVSKSTTHKDLSERLKIINKEKYVQVDEILKHHASIRHLRGGESTKNKYLKMDKNSN